MSLGGPNSFKYFCFAMTSVYNMRNGVHTWSLVDGTSTSQSRFGNAYYHASIACVHLVWSSFQPSVLVVNPRRACAERVTVVVSCVCPSVCLSVRMYVCPNTLFWQYAQLEV